MSTLQDVIMNVNELTSTLTAIDAKLDEIKAFIMGLQGNMPVTQEQLDALAALIGAAKDQAATVLAETDALDNP